MNVDLVTELHKIGAEPCNSGYRRMAVLPVVSVTR